MLTLEQLRFIQAAAEAFAARINWAWNQAGRPTVQVTSYWRDPQSNRAAGGDPASQHLIGTALDATGDTRSLVTWASRAGLIVINEGTHQHFQLYPAHLKVVRLVAPQLVV